MWLLCNRSFKYLDGKASPLVTLLITRWHKSNILTYPAVWTVSAMIMLMVICTDAWPCPKSYLLIRKQPLGSSSLFFLCLSQTLSLLPHLLRAASIKHQRHYAFLVCCSCRIGGDIADSKLCWSGQYLPQQFFSLGNWNLTHRYKYWTQQSSPIRCKWISCLDPYLHCYFFLSLWLLLFASAAVGPVELWWPVEHWCSRTSSERQGEALKFWSAARRLVTHLGQPQLNL